MHQRYNIQRYRKGDEFGIVELIRQEFNPEYNPEYSLSIWEWKYKENPLHIPCTIWIAKYNGKIIAHYAANPVLVRWGGKDVVGSQVSGIVTHRDHQRQGIFSKLSAKALEELREKGIKLTYVFPNQKSYHGFKKMGWTHVFSVIVMAKPLNAKSASRKYSDNIIIQKMVEVGLYAHVLLFRLKPFSNPNDVTVSEIDLFGDSFDILWKKASVYYDYIIKRDSKYLNWRYSFSPKTFKVYCAKKNDCISGYAILKCKTFRGINVGYIYDLFCDPNDHSTIKSLLSKSIEYFMRKKMDIVQMYVLESHPYYRICKEFGFLRGNEKPFVFNINKLEFDNSTECFKDHKKWLLSYGDKEGGF